MLFKMLKSVFKLSYPPPKKFFGCLTLNLKLACSLVTQKDHFPLKIDLQSIFPPKIPTFSQGANNQQYEYVSIYTKAIPNTIL